MAGFGGEKIAEEKVAPLPIGSQLSFSVLVFHLFFSLLDAAGNFVFFSFYGLIRNFFPVFLTTTDCVVIENFANRWR